MLFKGRLFRRLAILVGLMCLLGIPLAAVSAQGPTPTPTPDALGSFLGGASANSGTATPTPSAATPSPTPDAVKSALGKDNYSAVASGAWYDAQGTPMPGSVYVLMVGTGVDPKSDQGVRQIAAGIAALRAAYPTATNYHVLLLNAPYVYDASTTSNSLQLLNSQLITADAFIKEILANIRTTNLAAGGATSGTTSATATATRSSGATVATATRVPTRVPTKPAASCTAPAGMARLWIKNGYSGTMRFTIGGGEWGTHDFDIPADGQYHYVDMPPGRYTYSASIPGVGKANGERTDYSAGQCYTLTFQP